MPGATGPQGPQGPPGPIGRSLLACPNGTVLTILNARYLDCGDGTIIDYSTGLMWEQSQTCEARPIYPIGPDAANYNNPRCDLNSYTWSASGTGSDGTLFTDFLARLNLDVGVDGITPCFANHCDWRIPNKVRRPLHASATRANCEPVSRPRGRAPPRAGAATAISAPRQRAGTFRRAVLPPWAEMLQRTMRVILSELSFRSLAANKSAQQLAEIAWASIELVPRYLREHGDQSDPPARINNGIPTRSREALASITMCAYYMCAYNIGATTLNEYETWQHEYGIETSATPTVIWQIFCDVPGWKSWNAGIEQIEIDGPFATGTWFTMKPPAQDPLRSKLIEVRENACFVDETRVADLVIAVAHSIKPLGPGRTRINYAVDARGPEASKIGPAVAADFPEVLASLAKLAERRSE